MFGEKKFQDAIVKWNGFIAKMGSINDPLLYNIFKNACLLSFAEGNRVEVGLPEKYDLFGETILETEGVWRPLLEEVFGGKVDIHIMAIGGPLVKTKEPKSDDTDLSEDEAPKNFFSAVKSKISINSYITDYFKEELRDGYSRYHCPFDGCISKAKDFTVSAEKEIFYCFSCHKGGDVILLAAMLTKQTSLDAAIDLNQRYELGIKVSD